MAQLEKKLMKELSPKQKTSREIARTIKAIRAAYLQTERKIKASGIPFATTDVNLLIKVECKKYKLSEKNIRTIAGWENIQPGAANSKMLLNFKD